MRCFYPLQAWQSAAGDIHFYPRGTEGKSTDKRADYVREMCLPCGQCIGCRVERSRSWATRCMNEAQMHAANSFLTLTYSDEFLPYQGQLVYPHFQDFMKRLRYHVRKPLRYYMCGEYGDEFDRPHFHAILFGYDFSDDRLPIGKCAQGYLYNSRLLDSVWKFGHCSVGEVSFDSAAYVARYCVKKVTGKGADEHYMRVDGLTGEVYYKEPEFARMSLQNGSIGAKWLAKYESDVYNTGAVFVNGVPQVVPRYYDKLLKERSGFQKDLLDLSRYHRRKNMTIEPNDNSYERMRVKEEVFKAKLKLKKRGL